MHPRFLFFVFWFKKMLAFFLFLVSVSPICGFATQKKLEINSFYLRVKADAFYLKGEIALHNNQVKKALNFFKQSLSYAPDSSLVREKIAKIYLQENLLAEATREYELILEKEEASLEVHLALAQIYKVNDLGDVALKKYKVLASQNPKNLETKLQQALLFIDEKKWKEALRQLQLIESLEISSSKKLEIDLSQAYIYGQMRLPLKKQARVLKAEKFIDSPDSLFKVVEFLSQEENNKEAISLLERHQDKENFVIPVTKKLFEFYKSQGNGDHALLQLKKLQELGALEDHHYFEMALFFIAKEESDKAISFLEDFLIISPDSHVALYLKGALHEKERRLQQARNSYQNIPEESSYFVPSLMQRGHMHYESGDLKRASELLKPFVFKFKNAPQILLLYSQILWKRGRTQASLDVLDKGLRVFHKHPEILFLKGVYFYKRNPRLGSLKYVKEVLKQQPQHSEALNFLAYSYAEQNAFLDEAEKLSRKALSLEPQSSLFLDTMGWILYKKKLFKKALPYLEEAFNKNKTEKSIVKHLAKTYHQLGEAEKSNVFFKKHSELEKNETKPYEDSFHFFTQNDF